AGQLSHRWGTRELEELDGNFAKKLESSPAEAPAAAARFSSRTNFNSRAITDISRGAQIPTLTRERPMRAITISIWSPMRMVSPWRRDITSIQAPLQALGQT